jgi:hypothetical protein
MNKLATIAVALSASLATPALAQGGPPPDPFGDATVSKADFEKVGIARFNQLDANHDGSISINELPAGRRIPKEMPIKRADYIAVLDRNFDARDADHDGMLTKKERNDFRAQMLARRQQGGANGSEGVGAQ